MCTITISFAIGMVVRLTFFCFLLSSLLRLTVRGSSFTMRINSVTVFAASSFFRDSREKMCFRITTLKNFAKFEGKPQQWSLFLKKKDFFPVNFEKIF